MPTDRTRKNALRLCDTLNKRDLDAIAGMLADDYYSHAIPDPGPVHGPEVGVRVARTFLAAFPDYRVEVLDLVAEGDRAVIRFHETGTHLGDDLGIPASGRAMDMEGAYIWRFGNDGKLAEEWVYEDNLTFMQQLGVLPEDILDAREPEADADSSRI
jgi:C-1 hydroxylase